MVYLQLLAWGFEAVPNLVIFRDSLVLNVTVSLLLVFLMFMYAVLISYRQRTVLNLCANCLILFYRVFFLRSAICFYSKNRWQCCLFICFYYFGIVGNAVQSAVATWHCSIISSSTTAISRVYVQYGGDQLIISLHLPNGVRHCGSIKNQAALNYIWTLAKWQDWCCQ